MTWPTPILPMAAPSSILVHIRETFALALPVMVSRAGMVVMITVDSVMSGWAGANELAYYGIALAPQGTLLVIGFGLLLGTTVLTAQADGAGQRETCGRVWRLAMLLALILGVADWAAASAGYDILLWLGQDDHIAAGGGATLRMFGSGMPAVLLFVATLCFLEGIGRPKPGMVVTLGANILNVGLNWIMIFGHWGFPAMGAPGAALATSITRWAMFGALLLYVLTMPGHRRYGVRASLAGHYGLLRKMLRLGGPLALATGIESSAFSAAAIFAGWLGGISLAGYQIAANVTVLAFMLAVGVSTATAVRVGNAVGRGDAGAVERAGWAGFGIIVAVMAIVALALGMTRATVASLFNGDPAVIAVAAGGLSVVAFMMIVDGLQCVLAGALRGVADTIVPSAIYGLSLWVVTVPATYFLGIRFGFGIEGLLWGLVAGLILACALLGWRFHVVSRRPVRAM